MTDVIPLQIHPWPVSPERMEVLRAAKQSLGTELKVLPTEAVPGMHGRVLGLGALPPWLCDTAFVKEPSDVAAVGRALEWLLFAPPEDTRGFMVKDYLEAIFGHEVVELPAPKCKCEGCDSDMGVRNYIPLKGHCGRCYDAGCFLAGGLCLGY